MTHADLVFTGGAVFTAGAARPGSVAVRNGRIVAVGGEEVRDLIGLGTEVVDLRGGLLLPGFQDAHVHPVGGGQTLLRCDLSAADDEAGYLARVAAYADTHPDEQWILGGGWTMSAFPGGTPTARSLDRVLPNRPAFLTNGDTHGAWVNSVALRLAGIDRATPDPVDGRIERDASGEPTGTLHEGAMALLVPLLPEPTLDDLTDALLAGQRYLLSQGVTAWQDAIIGEYAGMRDAGPAYLRAVADGTLIARVVGAIWWDRTKGLEQLPSILERRERYRAGRFAATSVKFMQDGIAENFTASLLTPYCDGHGGKTGNAGISFVPPKVLDEAVTLLDAAGVQAHFHAIGDRAVRECLDAVEAAIHRNGRRSNRHHIAHLQVVHPDDIPRFAALDVAVNMQSLWATYEPQMTELTMPFLGTTRSGWQYPFGELLRAGARLGAGSDWPVSTPDPLAAIHTAVNRMAPPDLSEGDYPPFLPKQAIDLASSLTAYTAGSAWINGLDRETGTIAEGKLADLVVLDRDPFAGPAEEISSARVTQTFVDGVRVHAADDS
jgi:predicted amidohydrolase YtcJ